MASKKRKTKRGGTGRSRFGADGLPRRGWNGFPIIYQAVVAYSRPPARSDLYETWAAANSIQARSGGPGAAVADSVLDALDAKDEHDRRFRRVGQLGWVEGEGEVRFCTEPVLDNEPYGEGPSLAAPVVYSAFERISVLNQSVSCRGAGVRFTVHKAPGTGLVVEGFSLPDGSVYDGFNLSDREALEYLLTGRLVGRRLLL